MAQYDPRIHHRQSMRLAGYDYSTPGAYFVTAVVQCREHLFGNINDAKMAVNHFGQIVRSAWEDLPRHFDNIELDAFCIMPNHVHGVIFLLDQGRDKKLRLPVIVGLFKSFSARRINLLRKTPGVPVWQRNFHEHIIRNDQDYEAIYSYILNNPINWENDEIRTASRLIGRGGSSVIAR